MPVKKSSKHIPVPRDIELPFELGDLVLCRYSHYPYWPATIAHTHQKNHKGKHVCMIKSSKDDEAGLLSYWCVFSDEDTGGWVRADRMVKYHPDLVSKIRLEPGMKWTKDQAVALKAAERHFEAINEHKAQPIPVPIPPADFLKPYEDPESDASDEDEDEIDPAIESDGDGSDAEDEPEKRSAPDPPRGKQRASRSDRKKPTAVATPKSTEKKKSTPKPKPKPKRKVPATPAARPGKKAKVSDSKPTESTPDKFKSASVPVNDSPNTPARKQKKSVRAEPPAPSAAVLRKLEKTEKDLASANQTIAKLKKTLRKREAYLNDFAKGSTSVRIFVPPTPDSVDISIPAAETHHSKSVDSEGFTDIMNRLNSHFESFKEKVNAAEQARTQLHDEKQKMEEVLRALSAKVMESEQVALDHEKILVGLLEEILQAQVDVEDLRKHKAGNVIRNIGKMCNGMASIATFCNEIYSQWKKIVLAHVKNADVDKNANVAPSTTGKPSQDVKMKDVDTKTGKTVQEGKDSGTEHGDERNTTPDDNPGDMKKNSDEESKDDQEGKTAEVEAEALVSAKLEGSDGRDGAKADHDDKKPKDKEVQGPRNGTEPFAKIDLQEDASKAEVTRDRQGSATTDVAKRTPQPPAKTTGKSAGKSPVNVVMKTRLGRDKEGVPDVKGVPDAEGDEAMEDAETAVGDAKSPVPASSRDDSHDKAEPPSQNIQKKRKAGVTRTTTAAKKPRAQSENGKTSNKAEQSETDEAKSASSKGQHSVQRSALPEDEGHTNAESQSAGKGMPIAGKPRKSPRTADKADDEAKS